MGEITQFFLRPALESDNMVFQLVSDIVQYLTLGFVSLFVFFLCSFFVQILLKPLRWGIAHAPRGDMHSLEALAIHFTRAVGYCRNSQDVMAAFIEGSVRGAREIDYYASNVSSLQ